ncbi:post-GPI attachment to proteins factor 2-like [Onthophagus taurus]|uniref:post-GPI attachment to proteins factor 2-like n=1 Tax=Onthophagus taurus TaxID=166361 RepID=UPI000C1FF902|nr:post-GPI attachment to proteins factor 2-like [Onthophagus taurus]
MTKIEPPLVPGGDAPRSVAVHYSLSLRKLCVLTAAFPFLALVICLVTAVIFQPDEVHETHCRVYNVIPSISAITGVSPQRYLWRLSVALHITPRYVIATAYKRYLHGLISSLATLETKKRIHRWLSIAHVLNIVEVSALAGVTYISNIENYPIHEKLFITFMFTSLGHMLASIKALQLIAETRSDFHTFDKEIFIKKCLLLTSMVCTIGMIVFFAEHRLLCHDLAFSRFAFCEYVVATANMAFHCSLVFRLEEERLVIITGLESAWDRKVLNNEKKGD